MAFEQKTFQITLSEHALWMPVYTQPRHEFRLHDYLKERGIPVYLPVVPDIKIHRVHKGASQYTYRKTVLRPMFQSSTVALWFADLTNLLSGVILFSEAPQINIQSATCPLPYV
ncbi:MAG: hypothetical protein L6W00_03220 [Lentisphaeria bacterium]|nr:MAG: hypothetical protein L6W00_03220 [Lentisphaeria bacterium]